MWLILAYEYTENRCQTVFYKEALKCFPHSLRISPNSFEAALFLQIRPGKEKYNLYYNSFLEKSSGQKFQEKSYTKHNSYIFFLLK